MELGKPSGALLMSYDHLSKPAGKARQAARQVAADRLAEAATIVALSRAAKRSEQELAAAVLEEARIASAASAARSAAASTSGSAASHGFAAGKSASSVAGQEAKMLGDMFKVGLHACIRMAMHAEPHAARFLAQAIFPDLRGVFPGASRVAGFTSSLTASLALGGFVYVS